MSELEVFEKRQFEFEELVTKYFANPCPDIRDVLIVRCAPIVERIARKFSGMEPVDDLTQVGYIGLLNALSKFDPEAGVRFNTYATHLIAGEIKHYLRDRSMTIRHPAWLQELRHKVNKATTQLQADTGEMPSPRQIAEYLQVTVSSVDEVFATHDLLRVGSLDASPTEDGSNDTEKLDAFMVPGEQTSIEDRVLLEQAMSQLRELERDVLVLFHFDSLNQTEIAAKLGISCNYVSHILRQSLSKLRRILTNDEILDRQLHIDAGHEPDVMDTETGLYTHTYFKNRLNEELHRVASSGGAVGLVRIHIGGLRISRDASANQSVRELIQDAAYAIKETTRSLDVVCRDGQYGFAIILAVHGEQADVATKRIEAAMAKWLGGRVSPTSSIRFSFGHASSPKDGTSFSTMLAAATPVDHEFKLAG